MGVPYTLYKIGSILYKGSVLYITIYGMREACGSGPAAATYLTLSARALQMSPSRQASCFPRSADFKESGLSIVLVHRTAAMTNSLILHSRATRGLAHGGDCSRDNA
jgi:hypothetical protein